ncbi:hypothetical protein MHU86_19000 [Fragilaria crotonensis]|nr:hypothetical protein MHU86_19000 [Fragilaria crotonensis]
MNRIAAVVLLLLVTTEWSCAWVPSVTSRTRTRRGGAFVVGDTKDPSNSFTDGSPYSRELEEIEEMGGDPFFFTPPQEGDDDQTLDDQDEFVDATSVLSPSFLSAVDTVEAISAVEERYATDGKGPTPSKKASKFTDSLAFEWDGTVDEDAHLGLD